MMEVEWYYERLSEITEILAAMIHDGSINGNTRDVHRLARVLSILVAIKDRLQEEEVRGNG